MANKPNRSTPWTTRPPITIEKELAEQLLAVDWSEIVLAICAKKRWRYGSLAKDLNCNSPGIGRLARYEVAEPRLSLAIKLLDKYREVMLEDGD